MDVGGERRALVVCQPSTLRATMQWVDYALLDNGGSWRIESLPYQVAVGQEELRIESLCAELSGFYNANWVRLAKYWLAISFETSLLNRIVFFDEQTLLNSSCFQSGEDVVVPHTLFYLKHGKEFGRRKGRRLSLLPVRFVVIATSTGSGRKRAWLERGADLVVDPNVNGREVLEEGLRGLTKQYLHIADVVAAGRLRVALVLAPVALGLISLAFSLL